MTLDDAQVVCADIGAEVKALLEEHLRNTTNDDHNGVANKSQEAVAAQKGPGPALTFRRCRQYKLSSVVPEDGRLIGANKDFNWDEHRFLGDGITLTDRNGTKYVSGSRALTMKNGLSLTYGQINGLAGDFYGSSWPISNGGDLGEQIKNFKIAFNLLYEVEGTPAEVGRLMDILDEETQWIRDHTGNGEQPSQAYSTLPDQTIALEEATLGRPYGYPSYLLLSRINFDHFGQDARTSYIAGHKTALAYAASGDLEMGYMLNAFADHYLEDSFSAGHLRTPRRGLHDPYNPTSDICAKYMHDEDNALGLSVKNVQGSAAWTAVGDAYLRDKPAGKDTLHWAHHALQQSANEIYQAFVDNKCVPEPKDYRALWFAPSLESALAPQRCVPLFLPSNANYRRHDILNRTSDKFTDDWWYATTAALCYESGKWDYPITLN